MEATQQTTMAIAHLFYGVPLHVECVLTECSAQFRSMANVGEPLIAEQTMSRHVYRRGRLVRMQTAVVIRQGNLERVRITGTIVLLKDQLRYLEARRLGGCRKFRPFAADRMLTKSESPSLSMDMRLRRRRVPTSTGYPFFAFRIWYGMTVSAWLALLTRNRFAVSANAGRSRLV